MVTVAKYSDGDHISIVDGKGEVLAHGVMMDDEPDVEELFRNTEVVHDSSKIPLHWCLVAITTIVRGGGKLIIDHGHAFYSCGLDMEHDVARSIDSLAEECAETGFLLFHQWVAPRQRAAKKIAKRPPQPKKKAIPRKKEPPRKKARRH